MTLYEAIKRYTDNAEYERTHGNLQGCLDFYFDINGTIHFICKYGNIEMCKDFKNKRNDFCPLIVIESEVAEI